MDTLDSRDKSQIVIFQSNPFGNVDGHLKYLYITLLEDSELRQIVLLVTTNIEEYETLKVAKYPVALWTTGDGHQHTWNAIAKSKVVFIDELEYQMPQELRSLVGEGKFVNLWHGKNGKESGFKYLENSPQIKHYITVLNSIRSRTRMLSPGKGEHDVAMKRAFPGAEIFNAPDIRTWGILAPRYEQSIGVDQASLTKIKNLSHKYKILWCPTFRDIQIPNAYEEISLDSLNEFCTRIDLHLFVKPHRHESRFPSLTSSFTNLHSISRSSDVYPLAKYFQTTITDYSSIAVDFMENQIPTVLFQFDLEKYTAFRKITELPNSNEFQRVFTQEELESFLAERTEIASKYPRSRDLVVERNEWIELIKRILISS